MKTRKTWNPINTTDTISECYGGFYLQSDGIMYFEPNSPIDNNDVIEIRGMPSAEKMSDFIKSGTPFVLDHKTSRKFRKVINRLNNNHWRAERDEARQNEKTRRKLLKK